MRISGGGVKLKSYRYGKEHNDFMNVQIEVVGGKLVLYIS